jgi:hypothetical protein
MQNMAERDREARDAAKANKAKQLEDMMVW